MLDHVGLVHMNGRIYDPTLGRFLSADPFIQFPDNLQSYNRYSYVMNRPLSLTDPSGYFAWMFKNYRKWLKKNWKPIVVTVIAVVVTVVTWGAMSAPSMTWAAAAWAGAVSGAAGGFAAGFSGSLLYGGVLSDAFKAGFEGAMWGAAAGAAAGYINAQTWVRLTKTMAHGVNGGAISLGRGDSVEAGFLAGLGGGAIGAYMQKANVALKAVAAAIVGGTASEIGGGKFENGALTAAFAAVTAGAMAPKRTERSRQQMTEAMNRNAPGTAEEFFGEMEAAGEGGNWSFRAGQHRRQSG